MKRLTAQLYAKRVSRKIRSIIRSAFRSEVICEYKESIPWRVIYGCSTTAFEIQSRKKIAGEGQKL